ADGHCTITKPPGTGGCITICEDAVVVAETGSNGAAIGGGQRSYEGAGGCAGQIIIADRATVTAIGGYGASAIGRGGSANNQAVISEETDSITIGAETTILAYATCFTNYFAVDTALPHVEVPAAILNARFAEKQLRANAVNPILVLSGSGETVKALALPKTCNAFALTVGAGDFMVQNNEEG
ncbi:MAG: hypothetical protein RRY53_02040, partial [Pseudoflavonifractor sp.]